jgi:glycosyltransferase involved in cell wall biosynthesis
MTRILFLNPAGSLGGAERSLLDLMASLRAHSDDICVGLVVAGDGPLQSRAEALGVQVVCLPLGRRLAQVGDSGIVDAGVGGVARWGARSLTGSLETFAYVAGLRAAIRSFKPSVVHSNGIKMHLLAALARSRAPLIWHIRDFIGTRRLVSRAMALCAFRVDAAIMISRAVAQDARTVLHGIRSTVVYNAIDTTAFTPNGPVANLDELAGCPSTPPDTVRVGLVSTYARWKGHDVFLRACHQAQAKAPMARFYIIGGPIYASADSQFANEELRRLCSTVGLDGRVAFVPFQTRIEDVYRALDVVVHASTRPEPFGRTIVEAMATGRAVVACREGGATELFADGIDAIGVRPRDEEALANAIAALVTDPDRRRAIGAAARGSAVLRFSRPRLAAQVLRLYADAGCSDATVSLQPRTLNLTPQSDLQ